MRDGREHEEEEQDEGLEDEDEEAVRERGHRLGQTKGERERESAGTTAVCVRGEGQQRTDAWR